MGQGTPRPFLKWAGGKTYLLDELRGRIPHTWDSTTDLYVEPFVGAGALFWALLPKRARLNDLNSGLIATWKVLALSSRGPMNARYQLDTHLQDMAIQYAREPEATYYCYRDQFNACKPSLTTERLAALMIFLNKTCFNGLWRVNRKGAFNVPWGKRPDATIHDLDNLSLCRVHLTLSELVLSAVDFEQMCIKSDRKGALIYCDPPYAPVSPTANFTSYTENSFTMQDQYRLADWAAQQRAAGAHVIISQSAVSEVIERYKRHGFKCDCVKAPRRINSNGSRRDCVDEYIIY